LIDEYNNVNEVWLGIYLSSNNLTTCHIFILLNLPSVLY